MDVCSWISLAKASKHSLLNTTAKYCEPHPLGTLRVGVRAQLHLHEWQACMPAIRANRAVLASCACPPLTRNHPLSPPPLVHKARKVGDL